MKLTIRGLRGKCIATVILFYYRITDEQGLSLRQRGSQEDALTDEVRNKAGIAFHHSKPTYNERSPPKKKNSLRRIPAFLKEKKV
jgi:hypothetical protein